MVSCNLNGCFYVIIFGNGLCWEWVDLVGCMFVWVFSYLIVVFYSYLFFFC